MSLATTEWAAFFKAAEREFDDRRFDDGGPPSPIFDALLQRRSSPEPVSPPAAGVDPVAAFERDPLTAPIPVQVLVPEPSLPSDQPEVRLGAESEPVRKSSGRHRLRRDRVVAK